MDHTNEQRRAELARADRLLTGEELREKYSGHMHGGEHPQFLKEGWKHEVEGDYTLLGYWDWVMHRCEED